jgi:hypothetical protein
MKWLDEHRVLTTETLDALATSYAANDGRDEARSVLEYQRVHDPALTPDQGCRRLQHEVAVSDAAFREELERAFLDAPTTDPTCARIAAPLRCRIALESSQGIASCEGRALEKLVAKDIERCRPYVTQHRDATPALALLSLRQHWPAYAAGSCHWRGIGDLASHSLNVSGAEQLALAALENAVVDSDCSATTRTSIAKVAGAIKRDKAHTPNYDARITKLMSMNEESCLQFHP